jgi:DNA recombination protein RmuC
MSPTTLLIVGLGLGLLIGCVIGWLAGSRRGSPGVGADSRLEGELRQQLTQREGELSKGRDEITRLNAACATAEAQKAAADKLLADQRTMHEQSLLAAKQAQDKALADLRDAFKALSSDALKQSAPEFLRLAEQSFGKLQEMAKGDLSQRQEAIKTLVEPLKQQLETYQKRLQQSDTAQTATLGEVKQQLLALAQQSQSLASETQQFRMVLKSNQARGRWGEETLRRVVEAAGMSAHCDFSEQTQSGDSKPDLIVRLPGDRVIIVDAKVPDLDFLNAIDTADNAKRAEALATHAARLKDAIKALGARDYPRQFPNALDYVVLFLPAESLFSAALEGDHDLIVWAAAKRIMLATPASLIALLRSVSMSWQQHSQSENAQAIAAAAQELYQRVVKFTEHFERIRDGLEKANNAYNEAVGSYERSVKPSGERILKLGGGVDGKALAEVRPLETSLRLPPG